MKTYSTLKSSLVIAENPVVEYKEMTETAGYLPLEVRLKQLEQQGYIAKFHREEFDSDEISELWTRPDFEILPTDELEDVQEKMALRRAYLLELKSKHAELANEAVKEDTKKSDIKPVEVSRLKKNKMSTNCPQSTKSGEI